MGCKLQVERSQANLVTENLTNTFSAPILVESRIGTVRNLREFNQFVCEFTGFDNMNIDVEYGRSHIINNLFIRSRKEMTLKRPEGSPPCFTRIFQIIHACLKTFAQIARKMIYLIRVPFDLPLVERRIK